MAFVTISETNFTESVDTNLDAMGGGDMVVGTGFNKLDSANALYARASDDRVIAAGGTNGIYEIKEANNASHRVGGQTSVFLTDRVAFASLITASHNGYTASIQSSTTIKLYRLIFGVSFTEIGSNTGLSGLTSDYWVRMYIDTSGGSGATITVDYSSDGSSWTNAISVSETAGNFITSTKPATLCMVSGVTGYITSWKAEHDVTASGSFFPSLVMGRAQSLVF